MKDFGAIGPTILPLALLLTACSGLSTTSAVSDDCVVPPVYTHFYEGLIQPTWQTEATMRDQIPAPHKDADICWYGHVDGRVEARVNTSEATYTTYRFIRRDDGWVFDGFDEYVLVN